MDNFEFYNPVRILFGDEYLSKLAPISPRIIRFYSFSGVEA